MTRFLLNDDQRFFFRWMLLFISFFYSNSSLSQDSLYTRSVINTLTSESFHGRGYVKGGDAKAAQFIADEFRKLDLSPLTENYFQTFILDGKVLTGKSKG